MATQSSLFQPETIYCGFVLLGGTTPSKIVAIKLGRSQYHLAVAGGCEVCSDRSLGFAPTRYREVVLTSSKLS